MAMEVPRNWVQEQTCMRTEEVRLATDNVLTLRLLEPASVNLPPPLDRSLCEDLPRCPFEGTHLQSDPAHHVDCMSLPSSVLGWI